MSERLDRFILVGARFSRFAVNESAAIADSKGLVVTFKRAEPELSDSLYDDRHVIEIKILVEAVSAHDETSEVVADSTNTVIQAEIAAGFVGKDATSDGDLEAFGACQDDYYRFTYWMLRERLTSVLAVTMLRSTFLPWDLNELAARNEATPKSVRVRKKIRAEKNTARRAAKSKRS
jgi:hypothetical protein